MLCSVGQLEQAEGLWHDEPLVQQFAVKAAYFSH